MSFYKVFKTLWEGKIARYKIIAWHYLEKLGLNCDAENLGLNLDLWGFPRGSVVKNPPTIQEPQESLVQSLGWECPLELEMATHSSILAWKIPWTEEPGGLQSMGLQRVRHD